MKKISNEVKVGGAVLITIIAFIWLFNFLKGKDFFKSSAFYYTVYEKVGGLQESSPVEVNGYQVGVVQSIRFLNPTSGKLLAVFSVDRHFKIPKNTVARIVPVSVLGGMKVEFIYGNGPGFYSHGDTIPGSLAESLTDKIDTELIPVKEKLESLVVRIDTVLKSVDAIMDNNFRRDVQETLSNINGTTKSLNNILGSKEQDLKTTLDNVNKFSLMLANNTDKMNSTFTNLSSISDTLAAADIYGSILNLKKSLEQASELMNKMNDGKGTAGKLFTNDSLYTNLSNSLESLNLLLQDLKANPKRYVHFSVFGKK